MKQYIVLSILCGVAIACDTESEKDLYELEFKKGFKDGWMRRSEPLDFSDYRDEPATVLVSLQQSKEATSKHGARPLQKAKSVGVLKLIQLCSSKSTKPTT